MKAVGTYFEQVPKAVIEKILAQQDPPAENKVGSDETVKKWTASKSTTRSPKH